MQNQSTPSKFRPLNIPQSPVAVSPGRNLTGSARVARDIVADIFNSIQNWNDSHIKGANIIKQIGLLKSDNLDEYSKELDEYVNNLFLLVKVLKLCTEKLNKYKSQIAALCKVEKNSEPLFISLTLEKIVDLVEDIVYGYIEEFKVKELVLENIAHSKNKDELMFYAACWTHQPNITSDIVFKLEVLLVETGHRKLT